MSCKGGEVAMTPRGALASIAMLLVLSSVVRAQSWVPVYVENFSSAAGFQQPNPTHVQINTDDGQVHFNVHRDAGAQYVWRTIPHLVGDVRITVTGQLDSWSGNGDCVIGIGNAADVQSCVGVQLGFYGAGCATQGPLFGARGVSLNNSENPACHFNGPWLWVNQGTPYTASLTIAGGHALLQVAGVGAVTGTLTYSGDYTKLFVGNTGAGGFESATGAVDMVIIETLLPPDGPPSAAPAIGAASGAALRSLPNPFSPPGRVEYALPKAGPVRLDVFDVAGRRVRTIVQAFQEEGKHVVDWDGTNDAQQRVPPGTYFYSLRMADRELTSGKTTLIR